MRPICVPLVLLVATACGGETAVQPVAAGDVPDEVLAPAPWELAWTTAELATWREGTVFEIPAGGLLDPSAGQALSGVKVDLLVPSPDGAVDSSVVASSVVTGPDGRFRVGPGPAASWIVRLSKDGYTSVWVGEGPALAIGGAVSPPPGVTRFGMRRAHEVQGVVLDNAGKPLADVKLAAWTLSYREEMKSDAEGKFTAHAGVGPFVVDVTDPRFSAEPAGGQVPESGEAKPVTVRARASESVRGWVQDIEGRPLAGAVVLCAEHPAIRVRTDAAGRYEIRAPSNDHLAGLAAGLGCRTMKLPRAGDLAIWLAPSLPVSGHVVDAEGRPVADARLYAVVLDYDGIYERILGPRSRADGSFDFSWVPKPPRGSRSAIRILAKKRGAGESLVHTIAAGEPNGVPDLKLELLGAREVSGRVTSGDGAPIAGAYVAAEWGHFVGELSAAELAALGVSEMTFTHSDADGRWRLVDVPLGLHAKINCAWKGVTREVFVEKKPAGEPFDFVFEGKGTVKGRCVASDGSVAKGRIKVSVILLNSAGVDVRRAAETTDGTFRFDDLPEGEYQVIANADEYDIPGGALAKTGKEDAVVHMEKAASVEIHLKFDGGKPPDVPLEVGLLQPGGGAQDFKKTIPPGQGDKPVVISGIYPGPRKLEVVGDVWRGLIENLELKDGAREVIDLPVHKTLRVPAKYTDGDGVPVRRQLVVVSPVPPTQGPTQSFRTGESGELDITGVSPGRWRVSSSPVNLPGLEETFEVVAGENPPVTFRSAPAGALSLRVTKDGETPFAGAVVVLTDGKGGTLNAWGETAERLTNRFLVDAEGRCPIAGVRAGPVHIEVRSGASTFKSVDVDVAAGKVTSVEVK